MFENVAWPDHIIGIFTFYAFPVAEYLLKIWFSKKDGNPELWYLPYYGFRLVIRNIPRKVQLYDLKYAVRVRQVIPPSEGSSVATYIDDFLVENEDFFLLSGDDHLLLSFQLKKENDQFLFIHTTKLGKSIKTINLDEIDRLITDYTAHIDNRFHFDLLVGRRVSISKDNLKTYLKEVEENNEEQLLELDTIMKIG